jgi:hypothetical protein
VKKPKPRVLKESKEGEEVLGSKEIDLAWWSRNEIEEKDEDHLTSLYSFSM